MAKSELTVTVETVVTVPMSAAERCMRILEMWMDDNPNKTLMCEIKRDANGKDTHRLYIQGEVEHGGSG